MTDLKYNRYYIYVRPVIQNKTFQSVAPHIFSLLAIMLFTLLALKPTVETILNLEKSISNNKQILAALEKKGQDLTLGKKNLEGLGETTNLKIKTAVPDEASVTTIIASLQNSVAPGASISALQIQPVILYKEGVGKEEKNFALDNVEFSFSVQGTYSQLLTTLERLSKSPRLIQITSVSIVKNTDSPTVLNISGKGFYLK